MGLKEENQVRMVGVLPSQGADPIPVRLSTEAAGAGMIEENQVRMVGVLPSQGADPIPVSGMLYPSPISIPPCAFMPRYPDYDWTLDQESLKNRVILTNQYFYAPIMLPHGATVSRIDLFGYRDDADAVLSLYLFRIDRVGGYVTMASVTAGWTTGYSSGYDDSIGTPVVDNEDYAYTLRVALDPDAAVGEVIFTGARVRFTG